MCIRDRFNNALADSVLMANIGVHYPEDEALADQMLLMEIAKPISFSIIDRLLGGSGEGSNYTRDYTEIELSILDNLLKQIIELMREPWSNYFTIEPSLSRIETNSRLVQAISADETVLLIIINLKVKQVEGMINICMSGNSLSALLEQMAENEKQYSAKISASTDEAGRNSIMYSVEEGILEMKAVLGSVELNLEDVLTLHVGDVIELNQNVNTPVEIRVEDQTWFTGVLGVKKKKKAVKIIDRCEKGGKL